MLRLIALTCAAVIAGAGCGIETDTLSPEDAQIAYSSTSQALQVATDEEAQGLCPEGGTVSANVRLAGDEITLDASFDDCGQDGVIINGNLASTTVTREDFVSVDMDGIVDYAGAIEGTCRWNLSVELSGQTTSVQGEVCGQSASVLVTTSAP